MRGIHTIDTVVIHHSASPGYTKVRTIDGWHFERGFRRTKEARDRCRPELRAIGYHLVIYRDGSVRSGRALDEVGAHAKGSNSRSIGICLIGNGSFTDVQSKTLAAEIRRLDATVGRPLRVVGHRDVTAGTECPGFDVTAWCAEHRVVGSV